MSLANDFQVFVERLIPDKLEEMNTTIGEIAKKLNKEYYNLDKEDKEHMYVVGSVGRGTAIKGVSDLDLIFDLPEDTYKKFDGYGENSNGQSALLQEVKNILKTRYPKTDISGDGQVVVIEFTNYKVELVPGFRQKDDSFKYPNTHNGGSWKKTDPLPEIEASKKMAEETNNVFTHICNMLRAWKNNIGFKFGGLLIDSLVYKFLNENEEYKDIDYVDYFDMAKAVFEFLKGLDKEQTYWYALGSNQQVYNCDNGKFITKANKAYNIISEYNGDEIDINERLEEIFGKEFPENEYLLESEYTVVARRTEQFINQICSVDIQFNLKIDCEVTQDGYRPYYLRYMLRHGILLKKNKSLKFEIQGSDVPGGVDSCDIYWKVRNVGDEALRLNQIRGQVIKTNSDIHRERTSFRGAHYVECYLVKNGVCIARDKIEVPISES